MHSIEITLRWGKWTLRIKLTIRR